MSKRLPLHPVKVVTKVSPGKLRITRVLGGGNREKLHGICISEMQQVFLCFKQFSFNEEACANEITNFKKCYNTHFERARSPVTSASGKTSSVEINKLLEKYPDRKSYD